MTRSPRPRPLTPTAPTQPRTAVPTARLTNRARHDHPAEAAITAGQPQARASVAIRSRRPHITIAASEPQTAAMFAQPAPRTSQQHTPAASKPQSESPATPQTGRARRPHPASQPRTAVPTARRTNRAHHQHPVRTASTAGQSWPHAPVAIRSRRPHSTIAASEPQTAAMFAQPAPRTSRQHGPIASHPRTEAPGIRHSEVTP